MTKLSERLEIRKKIATRQSFKIFKERYVLLAYFPKLGKVQLCKTYIRDSRHIAVHEYTYYVDVLAIEEPYTLDYISLECIIKYYDGNEWHDFPFYVFAQMLSKIPKYAKYYKRVITD